MAQTLTQDDLDAIAQAVHNYPVSGIVGLDTFKYYWVNAAETAADEVRVELATELARIDVATSTRLATSGYTAPDNAGITTAVNNTNTLLSRIPATLFAGITRLAHWLGAIAGKRPDSATRAEINATPAGETYNETTDSQQAIKDFGQDVNLVSVNNVPVVIGDLNFAVSAGGQMVNDTLEIVPGDEYAVADGTAISFTDSRFPDLTLFDSAELTVYVDGTAVVDHVTTTTLTNSTKTISVELAEADTTLLTSYVGEDAFFDLELVRADDTRKTVARGPVNILDPLG